jgi:hypothetical protein
MRKNGQLFVNFFLWWSAQKAVNLHPSSRAQNKLLTKKQYYENVIFEICLVGSRSVYYVPHTRMGAKGAQLKVIPSEINY